INSENSSFESQDILQDASDNNITTTIATTSNDIYIYSITTATCNLRKHLDTHHPGWDSDKQSGQQCLIFIPTITISNQILTFAQKNKFNALIANIDLPSHETMKSTIQDAFIVMQKDIQTLFQKLRDIFAAFDISTKILCTTTNRGSNVILAMQLLKKNFVLQNNHFDFQSYHCLAHILNLIVIAAISSSSSITQDFRELEKLVGESEAIRKIPQDHLLQKEADLQAATQFLRPFYETINVLSRSMYTTLGLSILLVDDIINTISS
ncbi:33093_t:CDS:2, partial [Gigaspora margarita]